MFSSQYSILKVSRRALFALTAIVTGQTTAEAAVDDWVRTQCTISEDCRAGRGGIPYTAKTCRDCRGGWSRVTKYYQCGEYSASRDRFRADKSSLVCRKVCNAC